MSSRDERFKLRAHTPKSGCGKEDFKSFDEAKRAAARRDGRNAYKCPFCHGFHIGSYDNGDYKRRQKRWKRRKEELKNGEI